MTSIAALHASWRDTKQQPSALIADLLRMAHAQNPHTRIFTQLLNARAQLAAHTADTRLREGITPLPLLGVPVVVKDNIEIVGLSTSCGSKVLQRPPAIQSASVVQRLEQAGAIILGKTNLDEAALGATGRNEHFGRCVNPLTPTLLTGGSSSGSAAAVAAGYALAGIGTDTLGSVRIPAALCELVGFKPSHAAIAMDGVIPLYEPFDTLGILTRSIDDAECVFRILRDHREPEQTASSGTLRLLYLPNTMLSAIAPQLADNYRACIAKLAACSKVELQPLPEIGFLSLARAALWQVAHAFATRTLTTVMASPFSLGAELKKLLDYAHTLPDNKLATGHQLLQQARHTLHSSLAEADAILTPTCAVDAVAADSELPRDIAAFVCAANITGLPALAWPQTVSAGRTLSLQLIGRANRDNELFTLTRTLQQLLS